MSHAFDWGWTYTQIQNFRTKNEKCKLLNSTAIASDYAGRDPQGGTSDGSFLVSSLLGYKVWLKFFSSLKEKGKIELKLN